MYLDKLKFLEYLIVSFINTAEIPMSFNNKINFKIIDTKNLPLSSIVRMG